MLKNELQDPGGAIPAWEMALFSADSDETLRRYYQFHLKELSKNYDAELCDHLLEHYAAYLDLDIPAPNEHHKRLLIQLPQLGDTVPERLLAAYLEDMQDTRYPYTFSALKYFKNLLNGLRQYDDLISLLVRYNFNHPAFFGYLYQNGIRVNVLPMPGYCYDKRWPSLDPALLTRPGSVAPTTLGLDLSVAQLACLLRLNYQQGLYAGASLQEVFHFAATHFHTRRQSHISERSLAKEYYSISQITAATVRDMLMKQVAQIDREFFPS
ncbi:hypothetical protein ACFGVR_15300 [Mucilaginibacter sp. AW1-3]